MYNKSYGSKIANGMFFDDDWSVFVQQILNNSVTS